MEFPLQVHIGGQSHQVELSIITLMFYDTIHAQLTSECGAFDYFQYEDEDGDRIAVRGDSDLEGFSQSLQEGLVQNIWLIPLATTSDIVPVILPSDLVLLDNNPLSRGQFGTVYKALNALTDEVVAVKCLEVCDGGDEKEKALQELKMLKACEDCEFVVDILGSSFDSSLLLICLEFMDRGNLAQYGKIQFNVLRHITKSITSGLFFLWDHNIMHRDLKPDNVLVNSNGYVKLTDFGVSKIMGQSVARSYVGTNVYMAPERIAGGEYRRESDIWSLGLTVWQMYIGIFPLDADITTFLSSAAALIPPMLAKLEGEVELISFISQCVQFHIETRWNAADLAVCEFLRPNLDRSVIAAFVNNV